MSSVKSMVDYSSLIGGLGCGVIIGLLFRRLVFGRTSGSWLGNGALPASETTDNAFAAAVSSQDKNLKLILVVRSDLKMGRGKMAAQCCHAALGIYKEANRQPSMSALLRRWEQSGQAKVVVKVEDESSLLRVQEAAEQAGLLTELIADAGRTQIASGSLTVLGVGPAPSSLLEPVTGHLKLL